MGIGEGNKEPLHRMTYDRNKVVHMAEYANLNEETNSDRQKLLRLLDDNLDDQTKMGNFCFNCLSQWRGEPKFSIALAPRSVDVKEETAQRGAPIFYRARADRFFSCRAVSA